MQRSTKPLRSNHLDLAQRILEAVRRGGFRSGDRLAEQQIASLCNVSRTPVRAALRLLAEQAVVRWEKDFGFTLAIDPSGAVEAAEELPSADEERLAGAILRDRAARRLDDTFTAGGLAKRYDVDRHSVLKALRVLESENWIEKAPGQAWLFRSAQEGPEALSESYEYRLLLEPAALLAPGFRIDGERLTALRLAMEAQIASPDTAFDDANFSVSTSNSMA